MNWIGFKTLTMREVGRFFSVWRQTIIPGLITSVLYILIFGFTLEKRIESIERDQGLRRKRKKIVNTIDTV